MMIVYTKFKQHRCTCKEKGKQEGCELCYKPPPTYTVIGTHPEKQLTIKKKNLSYDRAKQQEKRLKMFGFQTTFLKDTKNV